MSSRNERHNPYARAETPFPAARPVVVLWRWRTEIALLVLAGAAITVTAAAAGQGQWWAAFALAGSVSVPATVPAGRAWLRRHFWCLFSRHRLQRVFLETPMHTRKGRIPLVLWMTPREFGERAFLLLRAGICAEDLEAFAGEIAAACCASSARVSRHPRQAQFVTVEIVRREEPAGAGAWRGGDPDEGRPLQRLAG
ncbi:hypothetical protein ACIBQ1_20815 [Nonomuraea sp. NPDC050153]|uniref:hypothetical protein n=1 Tax=Nonomuraea sp. NPDC050153 TaxID=3364359 RepID=UPI003789CFBC